MTVTAKPKSQIKINDMIGCMRKNNYMLQVRHAFWCNFFDVVEVVERDDVVFWPRKWREIWSYDNTASPYK